MSSERIARIARIAGVSAETARSYIDADWPNMDEHRRWLTSATDAEIAAWIVACLP